MKPMTAEEVKAKVKDFNYIWVHIFGTHYDCEFDDLFCLQVRSISEYGIDLQTVWEEMYLDFDDYGKTWNVYEDNPWKEEQK